MPLRPSRRQVLKAGLATGGALATRGLSPALIQALAAAPTASCGSLADIEHVVIFIQENRSFDHYFGRYKGVRGFDDRSVTMGPADDGTAVFNQKYTPGAIKTQDGVTNAPDPLLPFHIATAPPSPQQGECTNDVVHQWADQHASWNRGKLDAWVSSHLDADNNNQGRFAAITMGYYEGSPKRDHSGDVDLYWALADNFTICDNFYCSVIGGTDINRLYSVTGTCDPDAYDGGGQFLDTQFGTTPLPISKGAYTLGANHKWRPFPELLSEAGISWKVYGSLDAHLGDNVLRYFPQYRFGTGNPDLATRAFGSQIFPADFEADAKAGTLPRVSWVLGALADTEHAPASIEAGQDDAEKIVLALLQSPLWPKTALFITYDENGGFFDHVPPPVPNAGEPGEFLNVSKLGPEAVKNAGKYADQPIGLGFRVPALVISPFSRNTNPGGAPLVCSDALDLTSPLRFVERVTGVRVPRRDAAAGIPGLSPWRERNVGDLTTAFNFRDAPNLSAPTLPQTNRADLRVLTECPAPAGTLADDHFSPGYPIPADAVMPRQESAIGRVRRPSGVVPCQESTAAAGPAASGLQGAGITVPNTGAVGDGEALALGLVAVGAATVAGATTFLRRRGEQLRR